MTLLEKYEKCREPCIMIGDDVWCNIHIEDNKAYIAFQGTATLRGVFIDAMVKTAIYKNEPTPWKVHKGFGDSFKTAIDKIAEEIKGCSEVFIYGYSKGAAYAIFMHEWCVFNSLPVISYTFGAPAILWWPKDEIKDRFKNLYRIYIRGDWCSIIAKLLIGYQHVGVPVSIGKAQYDIWKNYHSKYQEYLKSL